MAGYWQRMLTNLDFWGILGLVAQAIFAARFIVQWVASEKKGESTIPVSFWYLSILGSFGTLAYGIGKGEAPVILGQLPGTLVYGRNLVLIHRQQRQQSQQSELARAAGSAPAGPVAGSSVPPSIPTTTAAPAAASAEPGAPSPHALPAERLAAAQAVR